METTERKAYFRRYYREHLVEYKVYQKKYAKANRGKLATLGYYFTMAITHKSSYSILSRA